MFSVGGNWVSVFPGTSTMNRNSLYAAPIYGCHYQSSPRAQNLKIEKLPSVLGRLCLAIHAVYKVYECL